MAEHGGLEPIEGDFTGKDIVSMNQFDRGDVAMVLEEAEAMETMVTKQGRSDLLKDLVIADMFFKPSTRTFFSFEAAATRLGAGTIDTQGVEFSSIAKGESIEDTFRTVSQYADTIATRLETEGDAKIAANSSDVPVVNGGDGSGEHPTQALLDFFTIRKELGRTAELNITMVGDLARGRTVHSLARLAAMYRAKLNYVSPKQLAMPEEIIDELEGKTQQLQTRELSDVIRSTDVLYVTRVQSDRPGPEDSDLHPEDYVVDAKVIADLPEEAIIMHPLPRVTELHPEVDSDPRAAYFRQVKNGMYVRMALLAMVNGRSIQ